MFNIFKKFNREKEKDTEEDSLISEPILSFIKSLESERSRYKMQVLSKVYNNFRCVYQVCIIDTLLKNTYLVDLGKNSNECVLRQMSHRDISDIKKTYHQKREVNTQWAKALSYVKISDLSWISEDEWDVLCKILKKKIDRKELAERRKEDIKKKIRNNKKRKEFKQMYVQ